MIGKKRTFSQNLGTMELFHVREKVFRDFLEFCLFKRQYGLFGIVTIIVLILVYVSHFLKLSQQLWLLSLLIIATAATITISKKTWVVLIIVVILIRWEI